MENLPLEIEQKLENLPVIPFDGGEEFQTLIMSKDFTDIFEYYRDNYLPDVLKAKPEIYQRVSLYLTLTNQDTSFIEQTDNVLYRRPVPTIEEFMENPRYFGLQGANTYPYWRKQLYKIFSPDSSINRILWSGATGTGKCEDVNTIIPTPTGYRRFGDIKPGEYIWGKNGKPTKVLNVYDRGIKEMYYVHFDDGTSTKCGLDHLWEIIDYSKNTTKIRDTKWLLNVKLRKNGKNDNSGRLYKYGIPHCQPVEYLPKNYSIDPYLLGVLLGDGAIGPNVCVASITNHLLDVEIIDTCKQRLPKGYQIVLQNNINGTCRYYITRINKKRDRAGFLQKINKLNLRRTCHNKFIPEEYLLGSTEQRLDLLRGLMDTDGSIIVKKSKNKPTSIRFGTVSKQLADDVAELVRSLGGRATIGKQDRTNKKAHCNHVEYEVKIWLLLNPFYLKRKAELFKPRLIKKKIISVTKADDVEAKCFEVDADDHLYLTKHYIVTHNTVTARKAIIYALYRLLCLRYPRAVLNCETSSTLAVFILSVTQKTAYQTNFEPFIKILENMPCFQRVRNMTAFDNFDLEDPRVPFPFYVDKANLTIVFKDNFILTIGSQISNTVGYDIVISGADEVNELGISTGMELLNSIDGRVQGRFAGSPYILTNVMSSARATDSVTKEYVKKWQNDKNFLYLHPMRFEVKESADFNAGEKFIVQIGNGIIPSKIVTDPGELIAIENNKYEIPIGCEIVKIPGIYKPQFEADIIQSIQDILGIDTKDTKNVFRDTSKLEDEHLCPELLFQANLGDNSDLFQMLLDNTNLFEKNGLDGKYYLKRAPKAERYVHCDLSSTGECDTGLSLLHKEYRINPVTLEKETLYVLDFIMAVDAKNTVDLESVEKFYKDLVLKGNVNIHTISCDQYQSEVIRQNWEKSGLFGKVEKSSVDIKLEPYINAANLMVTGQIKCGKCPKLKKELEALVFNKGKVEKTIELKDMADSLVGSIYNAQLNYFDEPLTQYTTETQVKTKVQIKDLIDTSRQKLVKL